MIKPYTHIVGYLHRWTILRIGAFHARIHDILSIDQTPFLHNHPFWYISIILRGGYTEQVEAADGTLMVKTHRVGSVISRKDGTYHRIIAVQPGTKTLFFGVECNQPMESQAAR